MFQPPHGCTSVEGTISANGWCRFFALKALSDDLTVNPWAAATWNLTAQAAYTQKYGMLRAEARARDAGTRVGGPRPILTVNGQAPVIIRNFITRHGPTGAGY